MTDKELMQMAQEAGIVVTGEAVWKLCELVAAAEREACAEVLDEMAAKDKLSNYYVVAALAIRARGSVNER